MYNTMSLSIIRQAQRLYKSRHAALSRGWFSKVTNDSVESTPVEVEFFLNDRLVYLFLEGTVIDVLSIDEGLTKWTGTYEGRSGVAISLGDHHVVIYMDKDVEMVWGDEGIFEDPAEVSLEFDDDVVRSFKMEELGESRIYVISWNMGAKNLFPIDPNASYEDQRAQKEKHIDYLVHAIPSGYDCYVVGVQECVSDNFFNLLGVALRRHTCRRVRLDPTKDRVWGRGDGSFINPKYTGIAVYVSTYLLPYFQHISTGGSNLSLFEGSKGGAGFTCRIRGTTLAFVSVHLPAKGSEERRRAYRFLSKQMGSVLGCRGLDLETQFHHVIFFGDTNYRTDSLTIDQTLELIRERDFGRLLESDDFHIDLEEEEAFTDYWEPRHNPTFYPTYKKLEGRSAPDFTSSFWVETCYRTVYKEPWYKSGKLQPRLPSYCDRVFVHSLENTPSTLLAEADGMLYDTYGAFNSHFMGSDHSAIYSGLILLEGEESKSLRITERAMQVRTMMIRFVLKIEMINISGVGSTMYPNRVKTFFPLPGEDGNNSSVPFMAFKHVASPRMRSQTPLAPPVYKDLLWRGPGRIPVFHLALKIRVNSDISGQCCLPIDRSSFEHKTPLEFREVRLYSNGVPLRTYSIGGDEIPITVDINLLPSIQ